jgi:hypothetical protein
MAPYQLQTVEAFRGTARQKFAFLWSMVRFESYPAREYWPILYPESTITYGTIYDRTSTYCDRISNTISITGH